MLPTYPYADYLKPTTDPDRMDYPVSSFDQSGREPSGVVFAKAGKTSVARPRRTRRQMRIRIF